MRKKTLIQFLQHAHSSLINNVGILWSELFFLAKPDLIRGSNDHNKISISLDSCHGLDHFCTYLQFLLHTKLLIGSFRATFYLVKVRILSQKRSLFYVKLNFRKVHWNDIGPKNASNYPILAFFWKNGHFWIWVLHSYEAIFKTRFLRNGSSKNFAKGKNLILRLCTKRPYGWQSWYFFNEIMTLKKGSVGSLYNRYPKVVYRDDNLSHRSTIAKDH